MGGFDERWRVSLNKRAAMRKRLPGWKGVVAKKNEELVQAIEKDLGVDAIQEAIKDGATAQFTTAELETPLHIAARKSGEDAEAVIECLLGNGAIIESMDENGVTPLHRAAEKGSLEVVACILGASEIIAEMVNSAGESALHYAAQCRDDLNIVSSLLAAGVPNNPDKAGNLPVFYALAHDHPETAKHLLAIEAELGETHWKDFVRTLPDEVKDKDCFKVAVASIRPVVETKSPSKEDVSKLRRKVSLKSSRLHQPRNVILKRGDGGTFGFNINGGLEVDCLPVVVLKSDMDVKLLEGQLYNDDEILEVNGHPIAGDKHSDVIDMVKKSGETLKLVVRKPGQQRTSLADLMSPDNATQNEEDSKIRKLLQKKIYEMQIPVTTRDPKEGETHGKQYWFVTEKEFKQMAEEDVFVEWGERDGVFYGTPNLTAEISSSRFTYYGPGSLQGVTLQRNALGVFGIEIGGGEECEKLVYIVGVEDPVIIDGDTSALRIGGCIVAVNSDNVVGVKASDVIELFSSAGETVNITLLSQFDDSDHALKVQSLSQRHPEFAKLKVDVTTTVTNSIPYTTRRPQVGEVNGRDYFFVSQTKFLDSVMKGEFVEWGELHGQLYGSKCSTQQTDQQSIGRKRRQSVRVALQHKISLTALQPIAEQKENTSDEEEDEHESENDVLEDTLILGTSRKTEKYQTKAFMVQSTHVNYAHAVRKTHREHPLDVMAEFVSIENIGTTHTANASKLNRDLNRYTNITAYDHSRVMISPDYCENNYINANYVFPSRETDPRVYIACQSPVPDAFGSFWSMIWQEKANVIVMVTNEVEKNRLKCHRYWPETKPSDKKPHENPCKYGPITVELKSIEDKEDYFVRTFFLTCDLNPGEKRPVYQFAFKRWPDHGAPKEPLPLLRFRADVKRHWDEEGRLVVHCSAGVGRSGTFIALDHALDTVLHSMYDDELLQRSDPAPVNILGSIAYMRNCRNYMVQTQEQYRFLHVAYDESLDILGEELSRLQKAQRPAQSTPLKKRSSNVQELTSLFAHLTEESDVSSSIQVVQGPVSVEATRNTTAGPAASPDVIADAEYPPADGVKVYRTPTATSYDKPLPKLPGEESPKKEAAKAMADDVSSKKDPESSKESIVVDASSAVAAIVKDPVTPAKATVVEKKEVTTPVWTQKINGRNVTML